MTKKLIETTNASTPYRRWSLEEEIRFANALTKYGKCDFVNIAKHVGTRDRVQCRSKLLKWKGVKIPTGNIHSINRRVEVEKR
jgi:hypothetical protein